MEIKGERWAFPLGGIGAPGLSLSGTGQLVAWQMMNNFHSGPDGVGGAIAPFSFFAVWSRDSSGARYCLLQKKPVGPIDRCVKGVKGDNRFPILHAVYDTDLPITVAVEAWSPFIPSNAKESGTPVAIFEFRLINKTNEPVEASVMMSLQNIIGWEGYGELNGWENEDFIGNFNGVSFSQREGWLIAKTREGERDSFADPLTLYSPDRFLLWHLRLTGNLQPRLLDWSRGGALPAFDKETKTVLWINEWADAATEEEWQKILSWVADGGVVILSGWDRHPLWVLDQWSDPQKAPIVLYDFEDGSYKGWTIEGNCFGERPATGAISWQQPVSGFQGRYFVNTFNPDDTTTGRAVSDPFIIKEPYLHFLIGGGHHPGRCCLNLLVDGKVVRSETGRNSEQLMHRMWDVKEFHGKEARLEIVDQVTGGWGHILVDYITMSPSPVPPPVSPERARAIRQQLPLRWERLERWEDQPVSVSSDGDVPVLEVQQFWRAVGMTGGEVLALTGERDPLIVKASLGKGTLMVLMGSPVLWASVGKRRPLIGGLLAKATEVSYRPMTGWDPLSVSYGSLALLALPDGKGWTLSGLPEWTDPQELASSFLKEGLLPVRRGKREGEPTEAGKTVAGALAGKVVLGKGQ
ncbi:MAG: GH116 family glycosyl-hydrolase, partial [Armatimonadetes bacterium]|nr:GH116 family glycosyl-hydrolase [Armatimonadota bacterium]MDW8122747.1 GH116 family glycosyl-hydrolase [Armatimonadota bacterium]